MEEQGRVRRLGRKFRYFEENGIGKRKGKVKRRRRRRKLGLIEEETAMAAETWQP